MPALSQLPSFRRTCRRASSSREGSLPRLSSPSSLPRPPSTFPRSPLGSIACWSRWYTVPPIRGGFSLSSISGGGGLRVPFSSPLLSLLGRPKRSAPSSSFSVGARVVVSPLSSLWQPALLFGCLIFFSSRFLLAATLLSSFFWLPSCLGGGGGQEVGVIFLCLRTFPRQRGTKVQPVAMQRTPSWCFSRNAPGS